MVSLAMRIWIMVDLRRNMTRVAMVLALGAVLGAMQQARAGTAGAEIGVSVTVMARTLINSESRPRQLEVSAADVARGYVDVQRATRLLVSNTNRRGYLLSVWPQVQVFSTIVVRSEDTQSELGADGGEIFERRWGQMLSLALDLRFMLAPGMKPGIYPWPVKFQVSPLTF